MSPWFDVTSSFNFHPLALVSIIAISCICERVSVYWSSGGCVVGYVCNICVSACDSRGGMRAARRRRG